MKKIIFSVLAIALTVGSVAGSAYALFSDTVTVSGISLAAGDADLQFSIDGETYEDSLDAGLDIAAMAPGQEEFGFFWLQNVSPSEIDLNVAAKLTAAGGDWADLSTKLLLNVEDVTSTNTTGWLTLAQWNAADIALPANPLLDGTERQYKAYLKVDPTATSEEIAGKSLNNVTFVFTGTQAL